MRLKNKREVPEGGYQFLYYAIGKEGKVLVQVMKSNGPISDPISQLTEDAKRSMAMNGVIVPTNLTEVIEHQICLRQSNPMDVCYSGGIGDDLHHRFIKPFLLSAAENIEGAGSGVLGNIANAASRVLRSVANCVGCAGTRVYDQSANNLGRAGTLNKITER